VQPDGASVTNEYTARGELKKTYGSRTYPVEYTFDARGHMETMKTWTDFAVGTGAAITTWQYDGYRGFLTNKLYADNKGTGYSYKPSGRLETRTWARGVTTTYGYNNAGEMNSANYSDSTPDVTYAHDNRGRLTNVVQGAISAALLLDDEGRLITETRDGAFVSSAYNAQFGYRDQLSTSHGLLYEYYYDDASRLETVTDVFTTFTYNYLANSRLVANLASDYFSDNVMNSRRTYDGLNRLLSVTNYDAGSAASNSNAASTTLAIAPLNKIGP